MNLLQYKSLYYSLASAVPKHGAKVATFDLDNTLIKTISGKVYGADSSDWTFNYPNVPTILRQLYDQGYHLVIFSNQKNVDVNSFRDKLEAITKALVVPCDIFFATEDDYFRKPCTGMWDKFIELRDLSQLDLTSDKNFYCGDAAGRPKDFIPGHTKDFSSSDMFFAHNIGLKFQVPENIFLGQNYTISLPKHNFESSNTTDQENNICCPDIPLFIIMVGSPASGKSTFAKILNSDRDCVHINQDEHKTKAKCLKLAKQALSNNQSLIIDNTNPSSACRKEYLDLLGDKKDIYHKMVVHMNVDKALAHHLNYVRVQLDKAMTQGLKKIPEIAFNIYYKKFEMPHVNEGFDEVVHVPFVMNETMQEYNIFDYYFIE